MLRVLIVCLTAALFAAVFFLVPPAEGLGNYVRLVFFHVPAAWISVLAFSSARGGHIAFCDRATVALTP